MTGAGAYDVTRTMTEAESLLYTIKIVDDTPPSNYTWVYDLKGCQTGQSVHLTEGNGITVNDGISTVIIDPGPNYTLAPGVYETGCLITDKTTGQHIQLFDGQITVVRSANA